MDGAVKVDCRLGTFAATAPDVNAEDLAALCGGANIEDLRDIGEGTLEVVEELGVVGVRMVRVEPRQARNSLGRDRCMARVNIARLYGQVLVIWTHPGKGQIHPPP